ncbi:MAG: hypothetical protein J6D29_05250 [Solobacterium sp.]|nr:hypothetical protein [Solobacterium sp.]
MNKNSLNDDKLEEVSGGVASPEFLAAWNAEYETYKSELIPGSIVGGYVTAIEEIGTLVEMIPGTKLIGLSFENPGAQPGDYVSVYIKSILPEKAKIKIRIDDYFPGGKPR